MRLYLTFILFFLLGSFGCTNNHSSQKNTSSTVTSSSSRSPSSVSSDLRGTFYRTNIPVSSNHGELDDYFRDLREEHRDIANHYLQGSRVSIENAESGGRIVALPETENLKPGESQRDRTKRSKIIQKLKFCRARDHVHAGPAFWRDGRLIGVHCLDEGMDPDDRELSQKSLLAGCILLAIEKCVNKGMKALELEVQDDAEGFATIKDERDPTAAPVETPTGPANTSSSAIQ